MLAAVVWLPRLTLPGQCAWAQACCSGIVRSLQLAPAHFHACRTLLLGRPHLMPSTR